MSDLARMVIYISPPQAGNRHNNIQITRSRNASSQYKRTIHASALLYFVYCIFRLYIFLNYIVGILRTAKEEFHCTEEHVSLL